MSKSCLHMDFHADVKVARIEDDNRKGRIKTFMAEIQIRCAVCNKPFQFLGLEPGLDLQGARVSLDGLEATIAICPQGEQPNPMQRMVFNVKQFDG